MSDSTEAIMVLRITILTLTGSLSQDPRARIPERNRHPSQAGVALPNLELCRFRLVVWADFLEVGIDDIVLGLGLRVIRAGPTALRLV